MKSRLLIAFMFLAGGSAFAQTRFSIRIGGGPGYYAPSRPYWGGAGYWGESPDRQHRRAEWQGLRNHHEKERMMYGDGPELREHQAQERWELRHEQWHESNGDYSAGH